MTGTSGEESGEPEGLPAYAIRFTVRALADVEVAHARFVALEGQDIADAWKDGLFEAVALLASTPHRQAVEESSRFRLDIRQLMYRRPGSRVGYRILFVAQDTGPDGPMVTVLALRHAAMRPISAREAREIERGR